MRIDIANELFTATETFVLWFICESDIDTCSPWRPKLYMQVTVVVQKTIMIMIMYMVVNHYKNNDNEMEGLAWLLVGAAYARDGETILEMLHLQLGIVILSIGIQMRISQDSHTNCFLYFVSLIFDI